MSNKTNTDTQEVMLLMAKLTDTIIDKLKAEARRDYHQENKKHGGVLNIKDVELNTKLIAYSNVQVSVSDAVLELFKDM